MKNLKTMVLMAVVAILAILVLAISFASTTSEEYDGSHQTVTEVCARINSTNIADLVGDMDPVIASNIDPCQPSEFVSQYVSIDPDFTGVLENYFGIVIVDG